MLDVLDDDRLRAAFAHPDAFVREETKEAVDAALYPWLLSHTRAELTAVAQAAGWPFTGVNTPAEVLEARHLHEREYWADWEGLLLPGPPYRHGEGGWRIRRGPPHLGECRADRASRDASTRSLARPGRPRGPPARGHQGRST